MQQRLRCKCQWVIPLLLALISLFFMCYTLAFIPMFLCTATITEVPGGWYIAHIMAYGFPVGTAGLLARMWYDFWTKTRYSSCPWKD